MAKFKTISEHELLSEAYYGLLAKWARENDFNTLYYEKHGTQDPISIAKLQKLSHQLDELRHALLKLEREA